MFKYWPIIRSSTFFKLGVTAAISYILYLLAGFLLPILLAIGLAFLLYPVVDAISQIRMAHGMIKLSWAVAIVLALLAFCIFIVVAIGFIILPLFGQMNEFIQKLPLAAMKSSMGGGLEAMLENPASIPVLPSNFNMLFEDLVNWAMGFVSVLLRNLLKSSMEIFQNLIGMIIVPFLSFYFLKDWRDLRRMVINLFTVEAQPKAERIINEIGKTLSAYVRGLGKLSLISGFCIAIGNMILGIELPLVLGFWAILAETVPVVGPLMGAVPAIFIAYGQSPEAAFNVALFYLVYYQIDANILLPRVMGKKVDVHPVVLIISLLIGAKLFGILGMVFAVPVAAVYGVLYRELWHAKKDNTEKLTPEV